jgi:ABC-type transporter Mla maintaining outer membrane lipid asymmetry ATPase subunit MlaF
LRQTDGHLLERTPALAPCVIARTPSERGEVHRCFDLHRIEKRFTGRTALQSIDSCILPARTLALRGPSGCGKSRLLKVLRGLVRPDGGEVRFARAARARATVGRPSDRARGRSALFRFRKPNAEEH